LDQALNPFMNTRPKCNNCRYIDEDEGDFVCRRELPCSSCGVSAMVDPGWVACDEFELWPRME